MKASDLRLGQIFIADYVKHETHHDLMFVVWDLSPGSRRSCQLIGHKNSKPTWNWISGQPDCLQNIKLVSTKKDLEGFQMLETIGTTGEQTGNLIESLPQDEPSGDYLRSVETLDYTTQRDGNYLVFKVTLELKGHRVTEALYADISDQEFKQYQALMESAIVTTMWQIHFFGGIDRQILWQ